MSRDVVVQDLPAEVHSVQDIPDDWRPQPLAFGAAAVRAAVLELVRDVDFSDPCWARVQLPGVDIEVSLADADPPCRRGLADHCLRAGGGTAI